MAQDTYRAIAIDHLGIPTPRSVRLVSGEANTMNAAPLLQLLAKVGIGDKVICSSVPRRHARITARVPRIHRLSNIHPLALTLNILTIRTPGIRRNWRRARRSSKTTCRHTGVATRRRQKVGIRRHHDIGHHATGRGAGDEDFPGIGIVSLDRVLDHVGEALVVAASIAGEALLRVDFPAVEVFGCRGEDGDEAFLVREGVIAGLLGVAGAVAAAAVELVVC